jgi:hypothetical protein
MVRFSPVHRGLSENQELDLGLVLPDLMDLKLDLSKWFRMVRSGHFRFKCEPNQIYL